MKVEVKMAKLVREKLLFILLESLLTLLYFLIEEIFFNEWSIQLHNKYVIFLTGFFTLFIIYSFSRCRERRGSARRACFLHQRRNGAPLRLDARLGRDRERFEEEGGRGEAGGGGGAQQAFQGSCLSFFMLVYD